MRIAGALLGLLCENSELLLLKFGTPLMLERKEPGTMALGVAADAPVQGGRADQGVVPLASPGAVVQYQSWARIRQPLALPVRLIITRLSLAYLPEFRSGPGFFQTRLLS